MHFLKVSSLLLGFVVLSSACPKAPGVHVAQSTDIASRFNFTAFQVSFMMKNLVSYYSDCGTFMGLLSLCLGNQDSSEAPNQLFVNVFL